MGGGAGEEERKNCSSRRAVTSVEHGWAGCGLRPPGWSAGTCGTGQTQCLGRVQSQGGSRRPSPPALCLWASRPSSSILGQQGCLALGLDREGPGFQLGVFWKTPGPSLAECALVVSLLPSKRRKLATESAPSPQGPIAEQFDFKE